MINKSGLDAMIVSIEHTLAGESAPLAQRSDDDFTTLVIPAGEPTNGC